MTPANLYSAKNLFLIFPAGCGGNHLANMISMSPVFTQRFVGPAYKNRMLLKYRNKFGPVIFRDQIAHFGYLENLQKKNILENEKIIKNNSGVNIWCAHYEEYFNTENILDEFSNRIFGVMSLPNENSIAHSRMIHGVWYRGAPNSPYAAYNYSPAGIINPKKFLNEPVSPNDIFTIDTDIFFSLDGYEHLIKVCSSALGIDLPEQCREMHHLWLSSVMRVHRG